MRLAGVVITLVILVCVGWAIFAFQWTTNKVIWRGLKEQMTADLWSPDPAQRRAHRIAFVVVWCMTAVAIWIAFRLYRTRLH